MSAGSGSLKPSVVENKVKTQASFMGHLGKFTFPVCVLGEVELGGGQRERGLCLHACVVVGKTLSLQCIYTDNFAGGKRKGTFYLINLIWSTLLRYSDDPVGLP